jgi:hypothetical protein
MSTNGYGIARSFELNSSFDNPATHRRPPTSAISVTVSTRAPRPIRLRGGFGSVTREYGARSSAISSILPAPSTRNTAGPPPVAPLRATDRNTLRVPGCTARSVKVMLRPSVPSIAATF